MIKRGPLAFPILALFGRISSNVPIILHNTSSITSSGVGTRAFASPKGLRPRGRVKPGHDGESAEHQSQPHLPAGEILHDLLRAAADRVDLHLAVDALDFDAAHEAGATENLH